MNCFLEEGGHFVRPAPVRSLNPFFHRRVQRSRLKKVALQTAAGFPHYTTFHDILRAGQVVATALMVTRLERVADAVGFPRDEIFLDGGAR
jgi:hypothetical protein